MTTSLEIDLATILERKYPHGFHAPADIDIGTFLEFADDDWLHEMDVEELLADKQLIGIIWNAQLILDERQDLSEDQAWRVLQACQPHFEEVTDPMRAIVQKVAGDLFPQPQGKAAIRALLTQIERQVEALPDDEQTDPAGYASISVIVDDIAKLLRRG
jgi:hypothetical protein